MSQKEDAASQKKPALRASWGSLWKAAVVIVVGVAVIAIVAGKGKRATQPAGGVVPTGTESVTVEPNEPPAGQQKALGDDNPLDRALQTGRPVLADFGRGVCIPCKMMKPILDDLKRQYEGKAEILIIDIDEYPALTGRCRIRAIPTQIFYDASGKEAARHEGFLPRADIVRQLERLGAK